MEKNQPISVAFEDIRNNPGIINNSAFRAINDDLGFDCLAAVQPYIYLRNA